MVKAVKEGDVLTISYVCDSYVHGMSKFERTAFLVVFAGHSLSV